MADEHLISLQPGTVVGGKYEVVKCLGSGSMGLVYACRHRELQGHMVAIKVLFPEVAQDKVAAARFRNEIFASYGVSHPNVVRAYEYLRDGDLVAYTMEYVGGGDLAEKLSRSNERMSIAECVKLLSQMCAGVQAIHDAGIVHRDLKPENILLTKDASVKIADFGIARNRNGPKLTEHGGVVGTIDYVSPEYMLNSQVDWRSDIYAIGILAYEMVTGESPFKGDSVYATMTKRLKTDPEPPSTLRSDCPPEFDQIILRAMHRDPNQRYQSAMEMFYDLQKLATDNSMKSAMSGGVFLPNSSSAASYVGPSLASGGDANDSGASQISESLPEMAAKVAAKSSAPERRAVSEIQQSTPAAASREGGIAAQSTPTFNTQKPAYGFSQLPSGTQILGPNAVPAWDEGANQETPELEQVLRPYEDITSEKWGGEHSVEISMNGERLSRQMHDLSQKYREHEQSRSYLMDVIVLVVAMIVGIVVGFIVLQSFFPELIKTMPLLK